MGVQQARCMGSTPHSGCSSSSAVGQQARVGGDAEVVAACVYGLFPRKPFHLGEETRGHSRTTLSSLLYARTGRSSDLPRSCVSPSHAPVAVHSGCTPLGGATTAGRCLIGWAHSSGTVRDLHPIPSWRGRRWCLLATRRADNSLCLWRCKSSNIEQYAQIYFVAPCGSTSRAHRSPCSCNIPAAARRIILSPRDYSSSDASILR